MHSGRLVYVIGAILLGLVGIGFGDFALQWQPVPAGIPMRTVLAYACAALLIIAGAATYIQVRYALALGLIYALWTLVLHGPRVAAHPLNIAPWNAFCEITALASAGFALYLSGRDKSAGKIPTALPRIAFGACAIVFGCAHFSYPVFTASMVPAWIPFPLFWAYATGSGHLAAGLAIVSGQLARLAATVLSFMMGSFVLLLHLPRVLAKPESHEEWTMLAIATSLTGAAWAMSRVLPESGKR